MAMSPVLQELVEALRTLPGVGNKTAERYAMHMLENKRQESMQLAKTIIQSLETLTYCETCRLLSETKQCQICQDAMRDKQTICVVHHSLDALAIEKTQKYKGVYFVLHGYLSPVDGYEPEHLGFEQLTLLAQNATSVELILALNTNHQGQLTSFFLQQHLPQNVKITQLAQGVPIGGELEYLDQVTLGLALENRVPFVG